jgi:very-short-patch-repair endonuclease
MILNPKILITVSHKYVPILKEKGYVCEKGDRIEVLVKDTPLGRKYLVQLACDYCGVHYTKTTNDWHRRPKNIDTDCCKNCISKKNIQVCNKKYGCDNYFQVEEFKEKMKKTNLKNYGVAYVSQSKEVRKIAKKNNLIKYGVENTSGLDWVRKKVENTNLERYGDICPLRVKKIKDKTQATNLEKYGFSHPMKNKKVKENLKQSFLNLYGVDHPMKVKNFAFKALQSRFVNGTHTCSKPQKQLYDITKGELNYPCERFIIDIALLDCDIAIEYNGSGHNLSVKMGKNTQEKFDRNEQYRRKVLYKNGYRIITFISQKDKNFDKEVTLKLIEFCKKTFDNLNKHWAEIYIDEEKLEFSNLKYNIYDII